MSDAGDARDMSHRDNLSTVIPLKRPIPYVNEEVSSRDLKYYIFDWDDNILHMPTKIRMEHLDPETGEWRPVEVSTSTFALVRSGFGW